MKQAVVIGGTRGIGAGVVARLLADHWRVTATGVSEKEVAEFRALNTGAECAALDVTDDDSVRSLFERFDGLDALVNCAGVLFREAEYDIEVFRKVVEVNLVGTMRTCLAAHPLLCRTDGAIVNTASMLSIFGGPLVPAYSASKGGVAQLTKALAARWASDGIRVNAVAPGWIETQMTQPLRDAPTRGATIIERTPMNRWGRPSEVGALVSWLVSENASFVTGSIYTVDGGYSAV